MGLIEGDLKLFHRSEAQIAPHKKINITPEAGGAYYASYGAETRCQYGSVDVRKYLIGVYLVTAI